MVMALETCRVMVGLSLMAFWYNVEQSVSVKPTKSLSMLQFHANEILYRNAYSASCNIIHI